MSFCNIHDRRGGIQGVFEEIMEASPSRVDISWFQGNLRGVSEALEKGAWTETRRPLALSWGHFFSNLADKNIRIRILCSKTVA